MNQSDEKSAPQISRMEHQIRIARILKRMRNNSLAIVVGAAEKTRSNDTTFSFRQSSDVLWLTGFPEPDAAIVLHKKSKSTGTVIAFVRPKDQQSEIWTGFRFGVEGTKQNFLVDEAYTVEEFEQVVGKLLAKVAVVYYKFGRNFNYDQKFRALHEACQKPLLNPEAIVHRERMIKSSDEVAMIRHAAQISAQAHNLAMMRCGREGASLKEYNLRATLHFHYNDNGVAAPAYETIVANGNNACTLHYTSCQDSLTAGSLVLIDSACEFAGYASDITRTFPVSGRFSEAQREIYDLVLEAQQAAIAFAGPGRTINSVHAHAENILRAGLIKLGVLSPDMASKRAENLALNRAKALGKENELLTLKVLYMHGTSHILGLDVHDVAVHGLRQLNYKSTRMKAGWVLTVEPGLYFPADDVRMPERYRGIGIRIEDDILITASGCEVLTDGVVKDAGQIEILMAGGKT